MDLHELATNAEINHWPPHLGVHTDAEKIAYLAERLREAADAEANAEGLADENAALREERDDFQRKWEDAQSRLQRIKELAA